MNLSLIVSESFHNTDSVYRVPATVTFSGGVGGVDKDLIVLDGTFEFSVLWFLGGRNGCLVVTVVFVFDGLVFVDY